MAVFLYLKNEIFSFNIFMGFSSKYKCSVHKQWTNVPIGKKILNKSVVEADVRKVNILFIISFVVFVIPIPIKLPSNFTLNFHNFIMTYVFFIMLKNCWWNFFSFEVIQKIVKISYHFCSNTTKKSLKHPINVSLRTALSISLSIVVFFFYLCLLKQLSIH